MLYGEILRPPSLRFNYSSTYATDFSPKRGLIKFGPYDSNLFPKDKIKAIVLYLKNHELEKEIFWNGVTRGEGTFRGFRSLFRVPLELMEEINYEENDIRNLELLLNEITTRNPDIIFMLLSGKNSNIYHLAKARFLANGIPSQMITIANLRDNKGRQYILENICLASYAKVGGTPWVISAEADETFLILGVSRTKDSTNKYFIGFVTVYTYEGDYLFVNSKAPVTAWDKYVDGLSKLVEESIIEFNKIKGVPENIIIHFHKTPGKKELRAVEQALKNVATDIPYALLHLNEYSNFRLFDSGHRTFIPPKGLKVDLSEFQSLLLVDGRIGSRRARVGVPRVLDIRIDKRSKYDFKKFPLLVKQIFDFSYVNWRSFNAAAVPITINYSKLIASLIVNIGVNNWNYMISNGRLRDKAWFL